MASITSIGVGSGLDLENLVSQIVAAERDPVTNSLNLKEANVQADISAFGTLKSTLSNFQSSLANLKNSSFFQSQFATSGDSTLYTATSGGNAVLGSYDIAVLYEASSHRLASADFTDPDIVVGSGSMTISSGSTSFDVTITSGTNDTLAEIRDAINDAAGNDGTVSASILTVDDGMGGTVSKLVLAASNSGEDNAITVDVIDDDAGHKDNSGLSQFFYNDSDPSNQLTQTSEARDAEITVDGFTAKSSTNEFSDTISGITINVLKGSEDPLDPDSASLVVSKNTSAIKAEVETFVASYNELATVLNELTDYDPTTQTRGLLLGDSTVNNIETQIRRILSNTVEGSGTLNSLASLGISTNSNGLLSLDSDELTDAVVNNSDDFSNLFSSDNGVATKLDDLLDQFLGSTGILKTREDGFQQRLDEITDQRDQLDLRLDKIETRLRAQYASLDILVSQLNSTGSFLTEQLSATAQIINRDNS